MGSVAGTSLDILSAVLTVHEKQGRGSHLLPAYQQWSSRTARARLPGWCAQAGRRAEVEGLTTGMSGLAGACIAFSTSSGRVSGICRRRDGQQ